MAKNVNTILFSNSYVCVLYVAWIVRTLDLKEHVKD